MTTKNWSLVLFHDIMREKGINPEKNSHLSVAEYKEIQYNKLADLIRNHLDMDRIYRILFDGENPQKNKQEDFEKKVTGEEADGTGTETGSGTTAADGATTGEKNVETDDDKTAGPAASGIGCGGLKDDTSGRGCVHIYCGDGKGKTTCVMGLGVRAAGAGKKVLLHQFLKDDSSSERNIIDGLANITVVPGTPMDKFHLPDER